MPELPEVETVRRNLERTVSGKTISSVKVFHPKMIRGMEVAPFVDALKQERIERVERRGKFLLFAFEQFYLVSHLRMEGKYFPYPQAIEKDKLSWDWHVSDLGGWKSDGASIYGVKFVPQCFLIDGNGTIIGKYNRAEDAKADLDKLLK